MLRNNVTLFEFCGRPCKYARADQIAGLGRLMTVVSLMGLLVHMSSSLLVILLCTTASMEVSGKMSDWPVLFQSSLASAIRFLHNRCQDAVHSPVQGQRSAAVARVLLYATTHQVVRRHSQVRTKTTGRFGGQYGNKSLVAQCVLYNELVAYSWDIVRVDTPSTWFSRRT